MRGVQAYARDALQLHRPDLGEGHVDPLGGIDDLLGDEDLTGPGVLGDPRGEVHRSSVVVALLEEDRSGVQANVSGWQAFGRYALHQLEGRQPVMSRKQMAGGPGSIFNIPASVRAFSKPPMIFAVHDCT